MSWVRIDDGFSDHPKVVKAGPIAAIIQIRALCYCSRHLTDGRLPEAAIPSLLHGLEHIGIATGGVPGMFEVGEDANEVNWADVLVKNGLWERSKSGSWFIVHDYLDYNPSKSQVLEARKNKRLAGKAGGQASAKARAQASDQAPACPSGSEVLNSPSPSPSPVLLKEQEVIIHSLNGPLEWPSEWHPIRDLLQAIPFLAKHRTWLDDLAWWKTMDELYTSCPAPLDRLLREAAAYCETEGYVPQTKRAIRVKLKNCMEFAARKAEREAQNATHH